MEKIKVKPNEVSRNKLTVDFKLILSKLNEKINQIETELKIGETTIRNSCDILRNDVQLAIEEAHKKLEDVHIELFDKIN